MKKAFKFTAEHFWQLVEAQKKRCALTNRELTPMSCELELRDIRRGEGRFCLENFYLVDKDLKYLCRHLGEKEVIELCAEVIQHCGRDYGYVLRKVRHE